MTTTPYCTVTDVTDIFLNIDITTAGVSITTAKVDAWILQESAYLDSIIKHRYVTPLLDPDSLLLAKKITVYIVASRVFSALQRSSGKTFKAEDIAYDKFTMDQGKDLLADLKSDRAILSNEDLKDPFPKSYMTQNSDLDVLAQDEGMTPVFRKNEEQW